MLTQNLNTLKTKDWFRKLACVVGIASAITLISFPVLAKKFYPPYSLFQPYAARSYPYRNSEKSIADTLAQDTKFDNLVYELKQAGLLDTLKQKGQLTIFAPTNEAFKALSKEEYQRYSQKLNRVKVLKYHVVQGLITDKNLNGKEITTLEGQKVKITVKDDTVKLNNATGIHPSTQTKNGVIIEVNRVLLPPGF
ncbi:fasciclin domain-containing protein [Scytonema sp. UIC 10036]|uniref:fasciclin domain-containing protein n=1 Tax=Scytonema sp. UIC 10036 TaxID=2304196 RepID=UPI0012DAA4EB|nr:fasciclin domain-containing protein [Scytonema sp. UIC 10036]MUG92410.1 fasciclin domain-containing protein [Scytonema sp. UIC 10036]